MSNIPRLAATPADVTLGPLSLIADGGARNFVVQAETGRFHGFVIRRGDQVHGYVDRCPHAGLPLAKTLDQYLTPDGAFVACSWHGALFDPINGRCVAGPCAGHRLMAWPVAVVDGEIRTIGPAGSHGA
jgi:nitrite reductase/ring-hydroxylating ferredoxin subunit